MEADIFNIQRFSLHDGPGIRTIIFLKGCPLRCKWCSNPESQLSIPDIAIKYESCNGCGKCLDSCLNDALQLKNGKININRSRCIKCGNCVKACPLQIITIFGKKMSLKEVMIEIMEDKIFYEITGGGVTLSGGEPCLQYEFSERLLLECKKRNIHTVVETSGAVPFQDLYRVVSHTNIIYYDLKHTDPKIHYSLTKGNLRQIKTNLIKLNKYTNIPIVIRIPIIPNYNTNMDFELISNFIKKCKNVIRIDILPYHELGKSKYSHLDRKYVTKTKVPSENYLKKIKYLLSKSEKEIWVRG